MSLIPESPAHIQPYHHPQRKEDVDLGVVVNWLHTHITESLCETIFQEHRTTEREREWSLHAMLQFWMAVSLRNPETLTELLDECRKGEDVLLPQVKATSEAFFSKAKQFKWSFFSELFKRLMPHLLEEAPCVYASEIHQLREVFAGVWAMDGSQLDAVARRMKILRHIRAAVLPGRVFAFYDLFKGVCRSLRFELDAARNENLLATEALESIPENVLIVGDRLFGVIRHFRTLAARKAWGVFRRNGSVNVKVLEVISRRQGGGRSYLEDLRVEVGSGEEKIILRLIRYGDGKRTLEVLTNVLDVKKLPPETVVVLYGLRWSIERMFYDLKIILKLNRFYAGNPNAIAAQFYATTMVYNAFRIMQARIAQTHGLRPETLSPAKLYPRLITACVKMLRNHFDCLRIVEANPGVKLNIPVQTVRATLETLLVQKKLTPRTKGRPNPRSKWLSWKKIPGGEKMLAEIS